MFRLHYCDYNVSESDGSRFTGQAAAEIIYFFILLPR